MQEVNAVKSRILDSITAIVANQQVKITEESALIGDDSILDSMKLVELCVSLEDLSLDLGFDFDWTSDVAMSKSQSMFRTLGSLTAEFLRQMEVRK
jgi:acyl carrier protein